MDYPRVSEQHLAERCSKKTLHPVYAAVIIQCRQSCTSSVREAMSRISYLLQLLASTRVSIIDLDYLAAKPRNRET